VGVHLAVVGRHAGQHRPDQRVAEPKGSGRELVEDARITGGVVIIRITLRLKNVNVSKY